MTIDEAENIIDSNRMRFFTKEFIKDCNRPAIYFLLDNDNGENGEIVYVGQTNSLWQRIYQHIYDKRYGVGKYAKNFEGISFFFCEEKDLDNLEGYFIQKYMPKYNKNMKSTDMIKKMSKQLDISKVQTKRIYRNWIKENE